MRLLLCVCALLSFLTNARASDIVIVVTGGDSLTGRSRDWPYHWWAGSPYTSTGTARGDCGSATSQASAIYDIGPVLGMNYGISGSRLAASTGSPGFPLLG